MRDKLKPDTPTRGPGGIRLLLGILSAVALLAVLGGCSLATERQKQLYDNESELAQEGDTFTYVKRVSSTNNESSTFFFFFFLRNGNDMDHPRLGERPSDLPSSAGDRRRPF
ncbi:hypothetical protein HMSSN139_62390 [Paenibacillus sp. HMSSN-139]|nr:hypothetical protein HMSSN139_62390 [Paenibacillus sp. HMSSN-139]